MDCPPDIDHRKKDNPYKSKYGDEWKKYLKKSVTFSHSALISDYIEHMMCESKRVMEGTIHEDTWMVYHDALSLMTEFMPLDAHLNQDVHVSHDFHKCITNDLDESDPKKFSGSTPLRLASSYKRLFHPTTGVVPTSNRIMEDITHVLYSLEKVRGARGCIVEDF